MKPTNAHKCITVSYIINTVFLLHVLATVCGHSQGGALQRTDKSRYYKSLWTNAYMQKTKF